MYKINKFLFSLCAILSLGSCASKETDSHESEAESASEDHSDEILLHAEDAERFGVTTMTAIPAPFQDVIEVSGQILNSPGDYAVVAAPKSGIVTIAGGISEGKRVGAGSLIATIRSSDISGGDPNAAAKASLDAAKAEYERLVPLHADGIVTTRDLNAARGRYEEAKALYSSRASSGAVTSAISGIVTGLNVRSGEYVEAGQPIATVAQNTRLTLKADVPERFHSRVANTVSANIRQESSSEWVRLSDLDGKVTGYTSGSEGKRNGYTPLYITFRNDGTIIPGSFAEVRLLGPQREGVLSVPSKALSEQQGQMLLYIKLDEEGYEKRPVKTGMSDGINTEILSGLREGEEVVVDGVTMVKLAESSGAVPEGHSHNH